MAGLMNMKTLGKPLLLPLLDIFNKVAALVQEINVSEQVQECFDVDAELRGCCEETVTLSQSVSTPSCSVILIL